MMHILHERSADNWYVCKHCRGTEYDLGEKTEDDIKVIHVFVNAVLLTPCFQIYAEQVAWVVHES